ncbi:MAG: flagellar biosynthesis protein FlhA [Capsulimonadaceae bacterium]|nr:flagellar biosynthesis protein FlhA [Capsulimonadaceae bacterium]
MTTTTVGKFDIGVKDILARIGKESEIALPIGIIAVIAMLILPMAPAFLDFCLLINISGAVLILLAAIYAREPLEFSIFPSLLLVTTLYRLALEISAMKLILGNGGQAGDVINAFGQVVLGGNYVVGVIVFAILVVVQFVVITAGAGRVAEVAARFTLDAMPGKQMAIDADLNAGLINQDQAKARRKVIESEADFYGAMDGASKFVRGDAIAAVVIIILNIVGGFVMGLLNGNTDIMKTLQTYTLVTVGEGLVAQIPALLISTASGLMVTRASSEGGMSADVGHQIFGAPRSLIIASCLLVCLIPIGFPPFQTLLMAGALGGAGFLQIRNTKREADVEAAAIAVKANAPKPIAATPESVMPLLSVDVLELEIGYGLMPLVDSTTGGDLLDRITLIRRQTAIELGLVIPSVRIRDNLQLKTHEYSFKLKGAPVATGVVLPNSLLIMDPGNVIDPIEEGTPTKEPAFGLPAMWIPARMRERAEMAGYTVVEPSSVVATHITELIKSHSSEILTRQDTQALIDHVKKASPAVVEELIPVMMSLGEVQKILQHLLRERISIRDMVSILETLADNAPRTKDPDLLGEAVRVALARSICRQYVDEASHALQCITLDPGLEQQLAEKVQSGLNQILLEPSTTRQFLQQLGTQVERIVSLGFPPVILCMQGLRLPMRRLTERSLPQLVILSYNEIVPGTEVRAVGSVSLE